VTLVVVVAIVVETAQAGVADEEAAAVTVAMAVVKFRDILTELQKVNQFSVFLSYVLLQQ
jgi:hypothetical protein